MVDGEDKKARGNRARFSQRNRWFADSSLEEAVLSELVSEAKFTC
jgi:hypothetical protein